jgi:hypothetical protein
VIAASTSISTIVAWRICTATYLRSNISVINCAATESSTRELGVLDLGCIETVMMFSVVDDVFLSQWKFKTVQDSALTLLYTRLET